MHDYVYMNIKFYIYMRRYIYAYKSVTKKAIMITNMIVLIMIIIRYIFICIGFFVYVYI
jgi:hypothetical protein